MLVHVTDPTFLRHVSGVVRSLAKRGQTGRIASSASTPPPSIRPAMASNA